MADMDLEVWSGNWGLPSIDTDCLAALAYAKFSLVPINVKKTDNPWRSPNRKLPCLRHGENTFATVPKMLEYFRQHNYGIDASLSMRQTTDVLAFMSLLEEKLKPAILYLWWMDAKNSAEIMRPWIAAHLPFWLRFFWPSKMQRDAAEYITMTKTLGFNNKNMMEKELEHLVYKEAKECLNLLECRLGQQQRYFFGDQPCSLDAIVYGYIAPLLKAPLHNNALQEHVKLCPNLCGLFDTITKRYFPPTLEEIQEQRRQEEEETKRQQELTEFPHTKRNMILAGLFTLTAMIGYAFLSGLVRIEITNDSDNDDQQAEEEDYIDDDKENESEEQ